MSAVHGSTFGSLADRSERSVAHSVCEAPRTAFGDSSLVSTSDLAEGVGSDCERQPAAPAAGRKVRWVRRRLALHCPGSADRGARNPDGLKVRVGPKVPRGSGRWLVPAGPAWQLAPAPGQQLKGASGPRRVADLQPAGAAPRREPEAPHGVEAVGSAVASAAAERHRRPANPTAGSTPRARPAVRRWTAP